MIFVAVSKLTGFVERTTSSLISKTLKTTDGFFSTPHNPITQLFFKSVHIVDQCKQHKQAIFATVGCVAIATGTLLADTPGFIAGFLATIGTTVIWRSLEDRVLIDAIVQRIFDRSIDLEGGDENRDLSDLMAERLAEVILEQTQIEEVKRLAIADLGPFTQEFLPDETLDIIINSLKNTVESSTLVKSTKKQAFLQLRELTSMPWILQNGKETFVLAFVVIVKDISVPYDLRKLAFDELVKMWNDSLEFDRDRDWIKGLLQGLNFKDSQFIFNNILGNLSDREYGIRPRVRFRRDHFKGL